MSTDTVHLRYAGPQNLRDFAVDHLLKAQAAFNYLTERDPEFLEALQRHEIGSMEPSEMAAAIENLPEVADTDEYDYGRTADRIYDATRERWLQAAE